MAVSPLNNPLAAALGSLGRPLGPTGAGGPGAARPGQAGGPRPQPAAAPAALRPQAPLAGAAAAAGAALPAEAPAGTDPALWSVLTGEERAFFARAAASGPLTYSRLSAGVNALAGNPMAQAGGAARGARLDVRG
jgi:hypothetical protein